MTTLITAAKETTSASDCIKYVDDTTVYEIISKNSPSNAQSMINEVATWSTLNSFQLHPKKM